MSKYAPFQKYLEAQDAYLLTLTMSEIEKIIGNTLPTSAYKYPVWWSNSTTTAHPYSRA